LQWHGQQPRVFLSWETGGLLLIMTRMWAPCAPVSSNADCVHSKSASALILRARRLSNTLIFLKFCALPAGGVTQAMSP